MGVHCTWQNMGACILIHAFPSFLIILLLTSPTLTLYNSSVESALKPSEVRTSESLRTALFTSPHCLVVLQNSGWSLSLEKTFPDFSSGIRQPPRNTWSKWLP